MLIVLLKKSSKDQVTRSVGRPTERWIGSVQADCYDMTYWYTEGGIDCYVVKDKKGSNKGVRNKYVGQHNEAFCSSISTRPTFETGPFAKRR